MACSLALEGGLDTVTFVVPGSPTRAGVVRLSGTHSPKGTLLCINSDKEMVVSFDALDVLAYLAAHDLVTVKVKPS